MVRRCSWRDAEVSNFLDVNLMCHNIKIWYIIKQYFIIHIPCTQFLIWTPLWLPAEYITKATKALIGNMIPYGLGDMEKPAALICMSEKVAGFYGTLTLTYKTIWHNISHHLHTLKPQLYWSVFPLQRTANCTSSVHEGNKKAQA